MKIEQIELHVGEVDFPFEPVRKLEAKCEATMAFSPAPTVDEMNSRLRAMAAKVGANAVINIEYSSGVSMTSWKSMKGTGLAVRKLAEDITCPQCAETVKQKAKACRFCGADLAAEHSVDSLERLAAERTELPAAAVVTESESEPLRETNNPQMWLIVGAIIFVILTIIGAASGQ